MEESEWKVELMACNRNALKEKPLSELLSDVDYLTETDLGLMAACDSLAGTCGNLMRIHGGQCTSPSAHGLKGHQGGLSHSTDVPTHSPRECGEGESSDELVMESPAIVHKYHEQWDLTSKPSHSSHLFHKGTFSDFPRPVVSELPVTNSNKKTTIAKERKGKAIINMGPLKTKHRTHTRAAPVSLSARGSLPTKQKPTQLATSCRSSRSTLEEDQGLVRRIHASSELTSKLNDSMDILRQQLDRIFDSSLNVTNSHKTGSTHVDAANSHKTGSTHVDVANSHKTTNSQINVANSHKTGSTQVDASIHCDLDLGPTRHPSSSFTYLNLSDQGYCSDGSTLDGTRAAHLTTELLSPGSLDSDEGTPLSPLSPSNGYFLYSPLSRLGSVHSCNSGLYPEGIVKNSMSPRSAFKKVVRFTQ